MKRFRFPLQPVAVLRAHREMLAREALAGAVQAYTKAEESLSATRVRVAQFEAAVAAGRSKPFSGSSQLEAIAAYKQECIAEATAERAVQAARVLVQQKRTEHLDAHRKVEILKRLEHKARTAYRLDCNREEQATLDDVAGSRFLSRRAQLSP